MAQYSVWVHGNAARPQWVADQATLPVEAIRTDGAKGRIPWSDIVGLPQRDGMTFRGRGRFAAASTAQPPSIFFHLPLPTPVAAAGKRAKLLKVFVLWKAVNATLQELYVYDGPKMAHEVPKLEAKDGLDGSTITNDVTVALVEGVTSFSVTTQPEVLFGLDICVGFGFARDGQITFTAAGADFEI